MNTQYSHRRWCACGAAIWALAVWLMPVPPVDAHNLDQIDTSIAFGDEYVDLMKQREALNQDLIQDGDEFWMIFQSTPGPGTLTGAGGYLTFYIPTNYVQVLAASYLQPAPGEPASLGAPANFRRMPLKGQSILPVGSGPIAPATTTNLIGLRLTNSFGQAENVVTAAGLHRGTLAGVYADTGIFYSIDPRTQYRSWDFAPETGPLSRRGYPITMKNNRGEWITPVTRYDAEQLIAYGRADAAPVVDPNGRGNTPWGLGNVVAGPESGYAWEFNLNAWLDTGNMQAAVSTVGPWQRIQYPGSQYGWDQAGLVGGALGYAGVDASSLGYALGTGPGESPLPANANAVRISYGMLELGRAEYAAVRIRVKNPPSAECFTLTTDALGGDAGGEQDAKDHEWRYYDPTLVTLNPCTYLAKRASDPLVRPGEILSFQITFINNGMIAYTNVVLTDTVPAGLTFLSCDPPQTSGPNPLVWNLGNVPPNQIKTLEVFVRAASVGTFFNKVVATSGTNILAEAMGTVEVSYRSLLRGEKTVAPDSVFPGETVAYTLTVYNDGVGANAVPLVINELLPPGFTYVNMVSKQINGLPLSDFFVTVNSANPNRPTFTVRTPIQAKKSLVLKFNVKVDEAQPVGSYCNSFYLQYEGKVISVPPQACVMVGGGQIGDQVYRDWDRDGVQDAGEEGIPGVTVNLHVGACPGAGAPWRSATTGADGTYRFTGLAPGSYCVTVATNTAPAGYTLTSANPLAVALAENEIHGAADFGFQPAGPGSISARVFDDRNGDGSYNGTDSGITNVTVWLYQDNNGNGALDGGDGLVATTNSAIGGAYAFTNLAAGLSYLVDVDEADADLAAYFNPNSFTATTPAVRAVPDLQGDWTAADFGFLANRPSSIGDMVFLDVNGSATYDAGDLPLPNIHVTLYRAGGGEEALASTVSDVSGLYLFEGLAPDTYLVEVDLHDLDLPGGVGTIVDSYMVVLVANTNHLTADFPFRRFIGKSVDKTYATTNETLTYTLTTSYSGDEPLDGVRVVDPFPAGVTFSNATAGGVYGAYPSLPGVAGVEEGTLVELVVTNPVADTYLRQDTPTLNYNAGQRVHVQPQAGSQRIGLMRFDLGEVPADSDITSAFFCYNVQNVGNFGSQYAYRMLTDWAEASATWNTNATGGGGWAAGSFGSGDYAATAYGPMSVASVGWKTNDVTDLVKAWIEDGATNRGVALIGGSANTDRAEIYDREDAASGLAPYLVINYQPMSEISSTNRLTVSRTVLAPDETVTVTMTLWASQTISNVTPTVELVAGFGTLSGPAETVPATVVRNTSKTFTYTCTPATLGELVFAGSAEGEDGYGFVDSQSPSVLVSASGSSNVVSWMLGTNTPAQGGVAATGGTLPSLYAFQGKTKAFWNYATPSNAWAVKAAVAANVDQGGALAYDGFNTIYGFRGADQATFWAYSISNNTWQVLTNAPQKVKWGGALTYLNGHVYAFRGDDKTNFWRYNPASNTWAELLGAPGPIKEGGALTTDGTAIFALRGDDTALFWKYDVAANAWSVLANVPSKVKKGGALTRLGDYIYALRGDNKQDFWRYSIADNAWSKLTPLFEAVAEGGSLATDGTYVYGLVGNGKKSLWRYNPTTGLWTKLRDAPGNVADGGALVYVRGTATALRQLSLQTDSSMVSSGSVVTVTLEPLSTITETNIRPSALTVTVTNGATATLLSGPTPTNIPSLSSNTPGMLAWTYRVNSGTNVGSVTFSASASNSLGQTFGTAMSGNILVVPPLKFQAKVNSPIEVGVVENTAIIRDNSGAIPVIVSETAITALSASIGDRVWADLNGDGVQDAGEPGVAHVTVWLHLDLDNNGRIDTNDTRVAETTTDLRGNYFFYGIVPGTNYTVTYDFTTAPPGYLPTTAGNATSPSKAIHDVGAISPAQQYAIADFGLQPPGAASIGDTVWIDANGNGARDSGEAGLPGVKVDLYFDVDPNGEFDAGDFFLQTALTDANGNYTFAGLNTNYYMVKVDQASTVTSPYGADSAALSNAMAQVSGANPQAIKIAATNEAYAAADFGYNWTGQIGDLVWWDHNRDQVPDASEPPVSRAYIMLYIDTDGDGRLDLLAGDYQIASQMTTTNGAYLFTHLPPGRYLVDVYEDSIGLDGPVPTTPYVQALNLAAGESNLTIDFGFFIGARIEGYAFGDLDRNQFFDLGETGLAGVTVYLNGTDVYGNAVAMTNATDADGHYLFLAPEGDYAVTYNLASVQSGYPLLREPTTDTRYTFHAYAGDEWHPSFDFGVDHAGRIGDTVFGDMDSSGAQEFGEPGFANVLLVLYDAATNAIDFVLTDDAGRYEFIGLDDATYFVQVQADSLPEGFLAVPTADPTPPADGWGQATVFNGEIVGTLDFGYPPEPDIAYYTVSGTIYLDADSNGSRGAGDMGLTNVTVRVAVDTNSDSVAEFNYTCATAANGAYAVAGIRSNSTVTITVLETTLPDTAYQLSGDPDGAPLTNVWTIAGIAGPASALDFGYSVAYGSVAGTVCIGDGDGLYNPAQNDSPLAGVGITLRYAGRDGILNTADDWVRQTDTGLDGGYQFDSLPPGAYSITENPVATYVFLDLADADGGDPNVIYVTLARGEDKTHQDFENTQWVGTAGVVWNAATISSNEFIWTDKLYEQRTEHPDAVSADIREVRMYANDSNFYIRVKMNDIIDSDLAYVAIGVDPRRSAGSPALDWLGDDANLGIGGDYFGGSAAAHYPVRNIIVHMVGETATPELFAFDGVDWYVPPSGWSATIISAAGETLELRIPRQDLLLDGAVTGRFTIASFLNSGVAANEGDSTLEILAGTPDAADAVSIPPLFLNDGRLDVSAWREDLADRDIDFWLDVAFDDSGIVANARPTTPAVTGPADDAEVSARPTLAWAPATDADGEVTGYFLEASTTSNFNGVAGTENGIIALRVNLPATQTNYVLSTTATQYWWRVRARDTAGMLSDATVQSFRVGGKTDVEGPVPTLLYVGTNLSGFLAGAFDETIARYGYLDSVSDAELASGAPLSFAIRWDDPSGVFATNWMHAGAGANVNQFTWNLQPEDGRVSPKWSVYETNVQAGTGLELVPAQAFLGSNVSAVGNAAVALTNWAAAAFAIPNYSESTEYYLQVGAEDACTQFGDWWEAGSWASYGPADLPDWGGYAAAAPNTARNLTTNFPLRIFMHDDDPVPPAPARGQDWAEARSMLVSNSTALLEVSRSGQAALYRTTDGDLLTNSLTLLFNVYDPDSGIQVGSAGPATTNTTLSLGLGARLANNYANYSAGLGDVTDTTADTTVLAWHWNSFTVDEVTELWGTDASSVAGATIPVRLTLWDQDGDRLNDQAVASNTVFGYLQLLDDDPDPPVLGPDSELMIGTSAPFGAAAKTNGGNQVVLTAWGFTDEESSEGALAPWSRSLLPNAAITWTAAYTSSLVDISAFSGTRENGWFGDEEQVARGQLALGNLGAYGFGATNVPWIQFKLDQVPASDRVFSWAEAGNADGFNQVQVQWSATGAEGSFATNAAWPAWNPDSGGQWNLRHLEFADVVPEDLATVHLRFVLGPGYGGANGYYRMDNLQFTGYPEEFIVTDGQLTDSGDTLRFRANVFDPGSGLAAAAASLQIAGSPATPNAAYAAGDGRTSASFLGWEQALSKFEITDLLLASVQDIGLPLTVALTDADDDRAGDALPMTAQVGQMRVVDDDIVRPKIELASMQGVRRLVAQWLFTDGLSRLVTDADGTVAAGELQTRTTAGAVGLPSLVYKAEGEFAAQSGGWQKQDRYWSVELKSESDLAITNISFQSCLSSASGPQSYTIRKYTDGVQRQEWGPFNFTAGAIATGTWYAASQDLTAEPLTLAAGVVTEIRLQANGCAANAMGALWALHGLTLWKDLTGAESIDERTDEEFARGLIQVAGQAWDEESGLSGTNAAHRNRFTVYAPDDSIIELGKPLEFDLGLVAGGATQRAVGGFTGPLPRLNFNRLLLGLYSGAAEIWDYDHDRADDDLMARADIAFQVVDNDIEPPGSVGTIFVNGIAVSEELPDRADLSWTNQPEFQVDFDAVAEDQDPGEAYSAKQRGLSGIGEYRVGLANVAEMDSVDRAAAGLPFPAAAIEGALANYGFEMNASGTGWTLDDQCTYQSIQDAPERVWEGVRSLKQVNGGQASQVIGFRNTAGTAPQVKLAGRYQSTGAATCKLEAFARTNLATPVAVRTVNLSATNGWTAFGIDPAETLGDGAVEVVKITVKDNGTGTTWWDELRFSVDIGTNLPTLRFIAGPDSQGTEPQYLFAVDADNNRPNDRLAGPVVPFYVPYDITPPTVVNMGVGGTNATVETVDDPTTQFDLSWSPANVGPDDPGHANHPTKQAGDRDLLSPWRSYKIYYGTFNPLEIPPDDNPTSETTGFIYTNFIQTRAYADWKSVTADSPINDPSAAGYQPDYHALATMSTNRIRLYDLDYDQDYVVVVVGVDKAGNEGPAGIYSWATNNTIRFALIRGTTIAQAEAAAAFPGEFQPQAPGARTTAALYWLAAGTTNAQGGYDEVRKDYDLLSWDAGRFQESSNNTWQLVGTVRTNWFVDDGGQFRDRGKLRFYRASYKDRWKRTNTLGQVQRPLASEEVYALHNVLLSGGQNYVALHGEPYANTLAGVFGGLETFPGGPSALPDAGSTLIEFYSPGTNAPTLDQYYLNEYGRWMQVGGDDVTTVPQAGDFFTRGFSITLPNPVPTNYATTTAYDYNRLDLSGHPIQVPAMVWSPIVQVPTNGFSQRIYTGNKSGRVATLIYNVAALRLPVAAHPREMNLLESGFVQGVRGTGDEIYTMNTATKTILSGSTIYCNPAGEWRFVGSNGLVPEGYFKPNDVIVIVSRNGGVGNYWTWTYDPASFYTLPTRWMGQ